MVSNFLQHLPSNFLLTKFFNITQVYQPLLLHEISVKFSGNMGIFNIGLFLQVTVAHTEHSNIKNSNLNKRVVLIIITG